MTTTSLGILCSNAFNSFRRWSVPLRRSGQQTTKIRLGIRESIILVKSHIISPGDRANLMTPFFGKSLILFPPKNKIKFRYRATMLKNSVTDRRSAMSSVQAPGKNSLSTCSISKWRNEESPTIKVSLPLD